MGLTLFLSLLVMVIHHAHSSYIALAPTEFHPGWAYKVQVAVSDVPNQGQVIITGTILNSQKISMGSKSVTLTTANGYSGLLEIQVGTSIPADSYTLKLDGAGGLVFTNTTSITLDPLTHLTFIQTDKSIYKASQLIRLRVMTVDKDLVPQRVAKNISIQNPSQSTLTRFRDDGSKGVFEETYQLTEFPDVGDWKIVVESRENNIYEELTFKVDEYVLPKFEVTAEVVPSFLIWGTNQEVTVAVTAKYTYGKGVMGNLKLTVLESKQEIRDAIRDPSGKKNVAVDLRRALEKVGEYGGSITIKVEVTDETQRTYETMVTVPMERNPVKVEFDKAQTDLVFRPGMPFRAVLKVTDPVGKPLDDRDLENPLMMTLMDNEDRSKSQERTFTMTPGMTEVVWDIDDVASTSSYLSLEASLNVNGKEYQASENIQKYETVGNATLNARWITYPSMLSMGGTASFAVDVSNPAHFSSLTYMIVSRGNIQAYGTVTAGATTNVVVTTDMCPKGRLVVYGITTVSSVSTAPEIIADSLDLKLEHCLEKKVVPSVADNTQRTGTNAAISVEVAWTNPMETQAVGQHDVYMLAVDKSIILLEGDNDINPDSVEKKLDAFNLPSVSGMDGGRPGILNRKKRSILPPGFPRYTRTPTSTGELLQSMGLVTLADVSMKKQEMYWLYEDGPVFAMADGGVMEKGEEAAPNEVDNAAPTGAGGGGTAPTVTVRKDFPDTWIWKSARTNDNGQLTLNEKLPDSITSWVISGFAVKNDSEIAVTANPFELNAFNPFFVSLNLPYSIRRTERFELRATVFNYKDSNLATTVTLASSDMYEISGDALKTIMVKSNSASSVTFMIVATTVDLISIKVTATAQDASGAQFTDMVDKKLIVKPEGVERMRSITFPVILSSGNLVFDQDVTLDFSPWTIQDVVQDSRRAQVLITGDMMGNALENIDKLLSIPTGCGEQNMITTVPNIYAMAYLTAINKVKPDFELKAMRYMKHGYTKETQEYRWDNGGYSAFGKSDQAASTWLTAFVLKSFAQAKNYIPDTVDLEILDSAVEFLFTRQTRDTGLFYELGRVIHSDMQGGTGAGDALSVYVVICMLESQKYGVEIDDNRLTLARDYVISLADGNLVKERKFLAAITAYALSLMNPNDANMITKIEMLIGYVVAEGAPWRQQKESDTVKPTDTYRYHPPSGPSDIETSAYCLLAYNMIRKVTEGREILLWLQKQQNSRGGFGSTQDTMMAMQAISQYSVIFAGSTPSGNIVVTAIDPPMSPTSVDITAENSDILQIVQLPDETNGVNIRVTGNADSIAVVKVVWHFYTAPNTVENPPSQPPVIDISKLLKLTTRTTMLRPGFHNVQACMKPEGLEYDRMMVMTLNMPSGFVAEDLQEARKQNPKVMRVEQEDDMVHYYLSEPGDECVNLVMEETVRVENLKPGSALLYAYYSPAEINVEASIQVEVPCVGDQCDSSRAMTQAAVSRPLLAACICLLLSLVAAL